MLYIGYVSLTLLIAFWISFHYSIQFYLLKSFVSLCIIFSRFLKKFCTVVTSRVKGRNKTLVAALELPYLNLNPSYSNFILCEVTLGMDTKKGKVFLFIYYCVIIIRYLICGSASSLWQFSNSCCVITLVVKWEEWEEWCFGILRIYILNLGTLECS